MQLENFKVLFLLLLVLTSLDVAQVQHLPPVSPILVVDVVSGAQLLYLELKVYLVPGKIWLFWIVQAMIRGN